MKKLKLLLVLSAFGLASCGGTAASSSDSPVSTSEEPAPSSSEAPSSPSSEPSSSPSSESSSESSSSHSIPDNDYLIEYEDYDTPKGYNVTEEEWDLLISEAAFNQGNIRGRNTYSSAETSDYGVRNEAEKAIRSYEGSFQESHWNFYSGRTATYTLDSEEFSSQYGGTYDDLYEEEIFFIKGNDEDGYGLYFNHAETHNGIEADPYTTELSTSETLETGYFDVGPTYDSSIFYQNAIAYNYLITLSFSPDNYDSYNTAYIKVENGDIYMTNYSSGTSNETVEVDGVDTQVPHHYISGTQFIYSKVEGLGYCLTNYTTMSMDYLSVDYYGNRLDEPIVTKKEITKTDWVYSASASAYEGETPEVITPATDVYTVTLDAYDTTGEAPVVSTSAKFNNVTGLYKQFIDPEFEGYAYRYLNEWGSGLYKVSVTGPEGYTPLTLGWDDVTNLLDFNLSVYESEDYDGYIQDDGYGYVSYMILLNADGSLAKFAITYLV